jgi:hypothetical protein
LSNIFFVAVNECLGWVGAVLQVVILQANILVRTATNLMHGALFAGLCGIAAVRGAETVREAPPADDGGTIPQPLKDDVFEALMMSSPFTRSLGLSDSLILTGVATFDKEVFATVLDTETMQSQVVSRKPNREGWHLIGVGGDPARMQTWTAKVQIPGGEILSIRYQKPPPKPARGSSGTNGSGVATGGGPSLSTSQMEEAKKAAVNYREGFTSDGYPNQPPPEMVEKLSRLSVGQRENINREMLNLRNRGLGMNERRQIYENLVNRASQGGR